MALEKLDKVLPRDAVISADYSSINYLLRSREKVYMFENPFRPVYFGVYGACDGEKTALRNLPDADRSPHFSRSGDPSVSEATSFGQIRSARHRSRPQEYSVSCVHPKGNRVQAENRRLAQFGRAGSEMNPRLVYVLGSLSRCRVKGIVSVWNFAGNYWWIFQRHCYADER